MTPIDEDDERYTISYGERPPNYAKNDFESVYSTLHFNIDQWPGGKLDRIIDNANYTCQSRSWQVSSLQTDGVTSTTYFRVECKPNTYYVQQKVNDIYSHTSLNNFVLLKMLHTSRNE